MMGDGVDGVADRIPESMNRSRGGFLEQRLDPGEGEFDGMMGLKSGL